MLVVQCKIEQFLYEKIIALLKTMTQTLSKGNPSRFICSWSTSSAAYLTDNIQVTLLVTRHLLVVPYTPHLQFHQSICIRIPRHRARPYSGSFIHHLNFIIIIIIYDSIYVYNHLNILQYPSMACSLWFRYKYNHFVEFEK